MNEQEILKTVDDVIAQGPFRPTWESLMQARVPDWFREKRLGIFTHWGVYSVPAAVDVPGEAAENGPDHQGVAQHPE